MLTTEPPRTPSTRRRVPGCRSSRARPTSAGARRRGRPTACRSPWGCCRRRSAAPAPGAAAPRWSRCLHQLAQLLVARLRVLDLEELAEHLHDVGGALL